MIRCSTHSLKFLNKNKKEKIKLILQEYRNLCQLIIDDLWNLDDLLNNKSQKYLGTDKLKSYSSWLSARMKQACAKQALSIINGTILKTRKKKFALNNQNINLDSNNINISKPNASNINIELDSRFIDFKQTKRFIFLKFSSIGNKIKFNFPIKETKMSRKWQSFGSLKSSIRLTDNNVFLLYDVEISKNKNNNEIVGADQGVLNTLTLSNGQTTKNCIHGHNLKSIQFKLSRKKKGSKSFKRAQQHRLNYINWSIKQLDFNNVKELRLEKIKQIRYKKKTSKYLNHWSYTLIKKKLIDLSEIKGFEIKEVSNEFRSQRCNSCGWVRKANRNGKIFKCNICKHTNDADLNASQNLLLDLFEIPKWVRLKKINRNGFFWSHDGLFDLDKKPIVSCAQE